MKTKCYASVSYFYPTAKNAFVAGCALIICLVAPSAISQPLVTQSEMRQHDGPTSLLQPLNSPVSGGPTIELLNPQLLSQMIKSPTRIELLFKPSDAPVNLSTFKVLYGKARFDITSRIMKKAKVGANTIVVEEAELPEGEHRFAILIADVQGRSSSREFSVRVQ